MQIDFSQYSYLPCLQCSEAEQIAYAKLSEEDKNAILPIFELSQVKYEAALEESVTAIAALVSSRPFVIDLSKDRAPPPFVAVNNPDQGKIAKLQKAQDAYNKSLTSLLNASDGFAEWRTLVGKFPNAVPVVQFTDPETQGKNILRQAVQLAKSGYDHLAIRITQETNEQIFPIVGQILAILDSAAQLLVIIDCGQGRLQTSERAEFAKKAIARIIEEIEPSQAQHLSAVCLSDSYTTPGNAKLKLYESYSWQLWLEAREKFPFLFGDYGANHRLKKANTFMPGEWKAQVVYPLDEAWIVYRHPDAQDANGWIEGSKEIKGDPSYDGACNCWGSELIDKAAVGDIIGATFARFWHAAKINMHIHRRIGYSFEVMSGSDGP
ncbi:beta family protein [Mesorhizobium sp. ESP6-5]|uniref:beta family protein n=1 Tax=Mesorhizobium sp. ESP6-5 TaxID=2876623 RepID=UPI001CCAEFD7|nr:beta family protein [Mesorhizobium sp. ESP6-5]MBZ9755070.1 beta family protein [Mesorhizobium sp. ESP6-5]